MVSSGSLDRLIRLEKMIETRVAGEREVTRDWALVDQVWANVVAPGGDTEAPAADQTAALQRLEFTIRFREDVSPSESTRIFYSGQAFNIESVAEIGRRTGLKVLAYARAEEAVA